MYIQKKLQEIQELVEHLENSNGLPLEQQMNLLKELEALIGENPMLIKYQSIILFNAGYQEEAKEYLSEGLKKYQRCYELYELQFEFLRYSEDIKGAFYALSKMLRLVSDNQEKRNEVMALIEETAVGARLSLEEVSNYTKFIDKEMAIRDYRFYPMNEYGQSSIRTDVFEGRDPNYSYLVNIYKTPYKMDVNEDDRIFPVFETIRGKFIGKGTSLPVKEGDILAVSSAEKESSITNITLYNLEQAPLRFQLEPNLIRYFKARSVKEIVFEADRNIFISHFKKKVLKDKPRLVMQIFLDGLSYKFLADHGFEKLMPNTYEFFRNGYINNNCHANGEWTLPSLMSMCTGKYTTSHYVFHTEAPHQGEQLNKMTQEYFEDAGYMTGRICPNWRGTPSYGYFKGTNRFVYAPMLNRLFCEEVAMETIEHIEAFKDFNNYVWMTMEDLHAVADGVCSGLLYDSDIEQYLTDDVREDSKISVFRNFNPAKIEEYKAAMKKVDFYLGIVFDYIRKNYKPDEYVVTLNSDHGQKFIEEDDYMFTLLRTNVPFMMAGRNVICKNSDELMSNVDILPTLLKVCGLTCDSGIDGTVLYDFGGMERAYTITESIFSGQTYKLAMNDKEHLFTFETKEFTRNDGLIPIMDYTVRLQNKSTGEDETNLYPQKVELFCQAAFDHIKAWVYLDK